MDNMEAPQKDRTVMKKDRILPREGRADKQTNGNLIQATCKTVRAFRLLMFVLIIGTVIPRIFFTASGIQWNTLTYYTVQTNLMMGFYWAFTALRPAYHAGSGFERLRFMFTVAILITGSLYFLFLHRGYMASLSLQHENGSMSSWRYGMYVADAWVNHFMIPLAALADFLLVRPHGLLALSDVAWPVAIPFTYFVFHTLRGLATGFYAYSFIDPESMGGWWNVMLMFWVLTVYVLLLSLACYFLHRRWLSPYRGIAS